MQNPHRSGIRPIFVFALVLAGGCIFAKVTDEGPGESESTGGQPGSGGSPGPSGKTGGKSGEGPAGTGGAPIIVKDAGTCIREPGQDDCMEVCKVESYQPERTPPDILIVLDRSSSMGQSATNMGGCAPGACPSKWDQTTDAIIKVVGATDTNVIWGLKFFGSDMECGVTDGVEVPLAIRNHDPITRSINAAMPISRTPTRAGMKAAVAYLKTQTDKNPKYIVLATDGQPTCAPTPVTGAGGRSGAGGRGAGGRGGAVVVPPVMTNGADDAGAVQAVADAFTAGFPTFVVGIATGTMEEATLIAMAKAGGVPRAGATPYFPVTSSADLQAALVNIAGALATCTYPLAPAGANNDPSNLAVHVSGGSLPQDAQDGWEFTGPDHTAVQLHGAACDGIKNNPSSKVEVFYGCPGQPPVP